MVKDVKGFSLLELMVVVAIIAILAALVIPSYQEHIRKVRRTEAQNQMLDIAQQLRRYKVVNFNYLKAGAPISLDDIHAPSTLPASGKPLYELKLRFLNSKNESATDEKATRWELIAEPISGTSQAGDGNIALNSRGYRCWIKGKKCEEDENSFPRNSKREKEELSVGKVDSPNGNPTNASVSISQEKDTNKSVGW